MSAPSRQRAGFSLLEVMVSLAILAVGLIGATAGQVLAIRVSTDSRERTIAMQLAEQRLETLQAMSGADVLALITAPGYPADPANPIDPDPGDGVAMTFVRRNTITDNSPETDVIRLAVAVDYTDKLGSTRTVFIDGLKSDR